METKIYDLVIIGGGPAGTAASVYAARKRLKTLIVAAEWGGQSNVSEDIQNWIGTPHISGADFAKSLKNHLDEYSGEFLEIRNDGLWIKSVTQKDKLFEVAADGEIFTTRAVLVASGGSRRKLDMKGAAEFENKGITYCASCDGPLFTDQDVVVVGGGNAGFETSLQLLAYCKSVTLLHRSEFKADTITIAKALANPKMKALNNIDIQEIKGSQFVSGVVFKNKTTGEVTELPVTGIFAEVGHLPNTGFVKDLVELDAAGTIVVNPMNQRTSVEGIWAAGDATNGLFHQNNIAAGDAVKALEDLYQWVQHHK